MQEALQNGKRSPNDQVTRCWNTCLCSTIGGSTAKFFTKHADPGREKEETGAATGIEECNREIQGGENSPTRPVGLDEG